MRFSLFPLLFAAFACIAGFSPVASTQSPEARPEPPKEVLPKAKPSALSEAPKGALGPSAPQLPLIERAPLWKNLNSSQKSVLSPLGAERFDSLNPRQRLKWVEITKRWPNLSAAEQERIQARMASWAQRSPEERARLREKHQSIAQDPAKREALHEWRFMSEPERARWRANSAVPSEGAGTKAP